MLKAHETRGTTRIVDIGPIRPGSPLVARWGFTADKWREHSYLWRKNKTIYLSLLWAVEADKGNLRALVNAIEASGFRVAVPHPIFSMPERLLHMGFEPTEEDGHEVWFRKSDTLAVAS
ncbi:hypothetical protein EN866_19360 [Mesorhizobium sp. M2D.F.Ca.ET.223.01.1.1]|uniref:hypothetical protein n=1 Tax=unclassified Mesorhizobium TaxID=325217 RepID=UPI000FCA4671|nr:MULTISPECIES: hypothetical protein [unclassified Mesorhizobium]TGP89319.1 hypothetical protein EN864_19370 [bacterium M00.F.Ca.ET.221.01.1.1]TGP94692.1 hypothetical protein EN865_15240 [bacterium M00.F.Ca.ET.222.01.1.1]RVD58894.1 hypothetical protein EN783_14755 [Mesorhizobium sp. M2D.F.Ca.ET.140.01.1.1]TGP27923.1 hypothetical protein EN875_033240 [Mesorhizobium sp. M2D.F.Ca.ET.232.01.1.1]TGP75860.1 hypothetical protein EN867_15240 [Mesorhizobium sp. M2D.F.Ca.ET.224.01.1.1]